MSDTRVRGKETYLGDGLYASCDGHQVRLRAPRGEATDHEVFLDATVLKNFEEFVKRLREGEG